MGKEILIPYSYSTKIDKKDRKIVEEELLDKKVHQAVQLRGHNTQTSVGNEEKKTPPIISAPPSERKSNNIKSESLVILSS